MNDMTQSQINEALIECKQLSYGIGDDFLVSHINCCFEPGLIHVLLGKNGAGKTSFLRLLAKELEPTSGQIQWQQTGLENRSFADLAKSRAVLPQRQELAFSITVKQLIRLGVEAGQHFQTGRQKQLIINQLIMLCDLQDLSERDMLSLSGGEQQRAQIARVLAQIWSVPMTENFNKEVQKVLQPMQLQGRWLLLDEWTTGLDLQHQMQMMTLFKQLARQGLGIIMSVHDINTAWQLADNAYLLQEGRLSVSGEKARVMTSANLEKLFDVEVVEVENDEQKHFFVTAPVLE